MIKFFRKIRYDLMEKNKTGKYFKYAIGEIVLVVIGILIALSINNWNEGRKLKIEERIVIKRLIKETKQDIVFYKSRIDGLNEETTLFKNFLLIGEGKANDSILDASLSEDFSFSGIYSYESALVKNNLNTYDEIIESEDIKEKLQEVFFIYEYVDKAFTLANDIKIKFGTPLDIKYYNIIFSNDSLLSNSYLKTPLSEPEVMGIIASYINNEENSLNQLGKMQKSLKECLALLETYAIKNR